MNYPVGITLQITDNTGASANNIANQLSRIGDVGVAAGERINESFGFKDADKQLSQILSTLERLYGMRQVGPEADLRIAYWEKRNDILQRQMDIQSQRDMERAPFGLGGKGFFSMAGRAIQGIGGFAEDMGAPEASGALEGIGAIVGKTGLIAAAVVGAVTAVSSVVDKLSRQYEQFIPDLLDTSAAFGELTDDIKENSNTLKVSLNTAAEAANQYGYSAEQGIEVFQGLARGGVSRAMAWSQADQVMGYARGYGVAPGSLLQAQILGYRYGQASPLGIAAGGVEATGMGAGRYEEYLMAMTSVFEKGISQGITKSFTDISGTMNFFSRLGETWKGQVGIGRIEQISGVVGQATSLERESDVLIYRAAQRITNAMGGTYIDVMKTMEKGITPTLFREIGKELRGMTGGSTTDMVEMMREMMGVNYTTASELVDAMDNVANMTDRQIAEMIKTAKPPTAISDEMKLLQANNSLQMAMTVLGENVITLKTAFVQGAANIVGGIEQWIGLFPKPKEEKEAALTPEVRTYKQAVEEGTGAAKQLELLSSFGIGGALSQAAISSIAGERAAGVALSDILSKTGISVTKVIATKYNDEMGNVLKSIGDKDIQLDPNEIAVFTPELQKVIKKAQIDISNYYKSVAPMAGEYTYIATEKTEKGMSQKEKIEREAVGTILALREQIKESGDQSRKKYEQALYTMPMGFIDYLIASGGASQIANTAQVGFFGGISPSGIDELIESINALRKEFEQGMSVTVQGGK